MNASSGPFGPPGSSRDPAPADGRYPRIPEPTQEELDALPVERRLELLESLRRREDQERDQRRQNRHQWFNSVGILFGVLFTAAGLIATGLTLQSGQEELRTAREGQITDRYIRAVEQLAASTADVRLGAVYALQRIAADSPKDLRGVYGMTPDEIRAVAVTDSETKFGERRTDPASCGPVSLLSDGPLHPQ